MQKVTTLLMFNGQAEEAMNLYTLLFKQSEILSITRYGANEAGAEGTVQHASFTLNGQEFMCIDSSAQHAFTFTPSISLYVRCGTEEEIDTVFAKLSQDGQIFMPLDRYPFRRLQNLNRPNLLSLDCQIQAISAGSGDPAGASWDSYFSGNALAKNSVGCPTSLVSPGS